MKRLVTHDIDREPVQLSRRRASLLLFGLMLGLGFGLPWFFLMMRTNEMTAVAAGIMVLVPSLFYTSLLASASIVTNSLRRVFRTIGLAVAAGQLFFFSSHVPNQTAAVVLTLAGVVYCFLVDVLAPHCSGEPIPFRKLWGTKVVDSENRNMGVTGYVPTGLVVDSEGDLRGIPTTGGSFTLEAWDAQTKSWRWVTYDVAVASSPRSPSYD
jgi:hypothetical protein